MSGQRGHDKSLSERSEVARSGGAPTVARWVIRDIGMGWFEIADRGVDGCGILNVMARAFSLGCAEVVRDALGAAWPMER